MQSLLKTRLLIATAATGILFGAAVAQDQPSQQTIPSKPQIVERDPFVNQMSNEIVVPPSIVRPVVLPTAASLSENPVIENDVEPIEPVAVSAPDVSVTGIVAVNGERQAILKAGSESRIVRVGQKLADYRVSRIDSHGVILSMGSHNFEVPLDSEF